LLTFSSCIVVINLKLQALEVHNKTYLSLIVIIISVGGWFLWDIILDQQYTMSSGKGVYYVPHNFLQHAGHNLLFWTVLLLTVTAVLVFEFTVSTLRAFFFPTDVDLFQEYEQDLEIRKRFEEAAASELQQGWNRGTKKSSFEIAREDAETEALERERERHVAELLARPRVMADSKPATQELEMDGYTSASASASHNGSVPSRTAPIAQDPPERPAPENASVDDGTGRRRSVEIQELFSKGFGTVRKGQLK
jgi:phospholipid-translocating ATPase